MIIQYAACKVLKEEDKDRGGLAAAAPSFPLWNVWWMDVADFMEVRARMGCI